MDRSIPGGQLRTIRAWCDELLPVWESPPYEIRGPRSVRRLAIGQAAFPHRLRIIPLRRHPLVDGKETRTIDGRDYVWSQLAPADFDEFLRAPPRFGPELW